MDSHVLKAVRTDRRSGPGPVLEVLTNPFRLKRCAGHAQARVGPARTKSRFHARAVLITDEDVEFSSTLNPARLDEQIGRRTPLRPLQLRLPCERLSVEL